MHGASSQGFQASAPGPAAIPQEPIPLLIAEKTPASSHRISSEALESPPPPSSSPHSALDAPPQNISYRARACVAPSARTPRPQISQKAPAPAPALLPLHVPLYQSPLPAVFRNRADRFSFRRRAALFPCAAACAAWSREYRWPPAFLGRSFGLAASIGP